MKRRVASVLGGIVGVALLALTLWAVRVGLDIRANREAMARAPSAAIALALDQDLDRLERLVLVSLALAASNFVFFHLSLRGWRRLESLEMRFALATRGGAALAAGIAVTDTRWGLHLTTPVLDALCSPWGSTRAWWALAFDATRLPPARPCATCGLPMVEGSVQVQLTPPGRPRTVQQWTFAGHAHDILGEPGSHVLLVQNVTERVIAEARAEEARLHEARTHAAWVQVIAGLPDGVLIHLGGHIRYANPAMEKLAGKSPLTGAHVDDLGGLSPGEGRLVRQDGSDVFVRVSTAQPIDFEEATCELRLVHDLTVWADLQAQLRMADRLASIGTLASGVAHEINNPLTWVLFNLETVQQRASDWESRQLLAEAREGTEQVRRIVEDLRSYARPQGEEIGPTDLAAAISAAARLAGPHLEACATLHVDCPPETWVLGSDARLAQVFLNLLVNAAQATEEAGGTRHQVGITVSPEGDRVVVTVVDDGPGISAEHLPHVFDPFFTTKAAGKGTGIGLYVCHRIVTSLGGDISIVSEEGNGVRVRVALVASAPPADVDLAPAPKPSARLRILLVDDEPLVARALAGMLREFEVVIAHSVEEALARVADRPFDAILCDLNMPDVPGRVLHARLDPVHRARLAFMTGGVHSEADRRLIVEMGRAPLDKPFLREEVLETVARLGRA